MNRFTILVLFFVICGCKRETQTDARQDATPKISLSLQQRAADLQAGTPMSEVLAIANLTEGAGAKRNYIYSDFCGSMQEWMTQDGDEIYLQGHLFDQDGYREKSYVIAILRKSSVTGEYEEIIWLGPNLQTGEDIFTKQSSEK